MTELVSSIAIVFFFLFFYYFCIFLSVGFFTSCFQLDRHRVVFLRTMPFPRALSVFLAVVAWSQAARSATHERNANMANKSGGLVPAKTSRGPVLGFKSSGNTTCFKGIPFGAAPVGDKRFKAPEPPKDWVLPRPCIADVLMCPQVGGAKTVLFLPFSCLLLLSVRCSDYDCFC